MNSDKIICRFGALCVLSFDFVENARATRYVMWTKKKKILLIARGRPNFPVL